VACVTRAITLPTINLSNQRAPEGRKRVAQGERKRALGFVRLNDRALEEGDRTGSVGIPACAERVSANQI
jgi:hypothetical protein